MASMQLLLRTWRARSSCCSVGKSLSKAGRRTLATATATVRARPRGGLSYKPSCPPVLTAANVFPGGPVNPSAFGNIWHRIPCYSVFVPGRSFCERNRTDLSYADLEALIKARDIQLIDVREPRELDEYGKIPGAVNIPLDQLSNALRLPEDKYEVRFGVKKPSEDDSNIVFSCLGGVRSRTAMHKAQELGFTKARHYVGGWEDYANNTGQPVKKNDQSKA